MRTGWAIIVAAGRALGLAGPATAAPPGAGLPAPELRPAPASPHLLYHG
jgi:hypothetical protein